MPGQQIQTDHDRLDRLTQSVLPWWGTYRKNRKVLLVEALEDDYDFIAALVELGCSVRVTHPDDKIVGRLAKLWPKGRIHPYSGSISTHCWTLGKINEGGRVNGTLDTVVLMNGALLGADRPDALPTLQRIEQLVVNVMACAIPWGQSGKKAWVADPILFRAQDYDVATMGEEEGGWFIAHKSIER